MRVRALVLPHDAFGTHKWTDLRTTSITTNHYLLLVLFTECTTNKVRFCVRILISDT